MTQEQLKTILANHQLITEFVNSWNHYHRLKRNRLMYEVFTPTLIKWWHKLRGIKPYMNLYYEPKL